MQIHRLFEIIYLLMEKREMTAGALAAHFEVSPRTILRDVESLSMAGIPIYTAQGKGGGVRLMDSFVLNQSVLTDREQQSILSALRGFQAVQVPEADAMLTKLGAIFNKNAAAWIDIDFSPWDSSSGERDKFPLLRDAILERRLISFDYYSYQGEKSHRSAEPLQIVFKEKAWYLSAFCTQRQDYRTFKLSRIQNLAVNNQTFAPRDIRPVSGIIGPAALCPVTLKIDRALYHRLGSDFTQVTDNGDGSYTVVGLFPDDDWGHSVILSFGEHAQVLAPKALRNTIGQKLAAAAKKYL